MQENKCCMTQPCVQEYIIFHNHTQTRQTHSNQVLWKQIKMILLVFLPLFCLFFDTECFYVLALCVINYILQLSGGSLQLKLLFSCMKYNLLHLPSVMPLYSLEVCVCACVWRMVCKEGGRIVSVVILSSSHINQPLSNWHTLLIMSAANQAASTRQHTVKTSSLVNAELTPICCACMSWACEDCLFEESSLHTGSTGPIFRSLRAGDWSPDCRGISHCCSLGSIPSSLHIRQMNSEKLSEELCDSPSNRSTTKPSGRDTIGISSRGLCLDVLQMFLTNSTTYDLQNRLWDSHHITRRW